MLLHSYNQLNNHVHYIPRPCATVTHFDAPFASLSFPGSEDDDGGIDYAAMSAIFEWHFVEILGYQERA